MKSICVYCGSSPGERPEYKANAIALGNEMVKRGLTLVYGGGNVGLMGVVADAVLHGGSPVIGIIPKSLVRKEV
ncbi:TIGR00730 family Rossman fold protein, partial [Escherichia coli]|nr:TIGR00730 family Rossman fold protein [Escherichia coli]